MAATEVKASKSSISDDISKFVSHSECTMIAGGIAGCVGKTITAPLSRLTILLQVLPLSQVSLSGAASTASSSLKLNGSLLQATKKVFAEEGILSFWKGNLTSVFHRFPYSAINFTVYDELQMLTRKLYGSESPMTRFACGSIAGGAACVACYPLDLVRTQLTVLKAPTAGTKKSVYGCISSTIQSIIEQEGIRGLYRGLFISLAVTIPTFGISFCVYGTVKETILNERLGNLNFLKDPCTGHLNAYGSMASGALSGIVSSTLLFPADSVRRRMQVEKVLLHADHKENIPQHNVKKSGATAEMIRVLKGDGIRGLYRGLLPEILKVTPMVSITFCVYEYTYDLLNNQLCST